MWFFLVQTLGALAAAMGLGLLAGWLLFGGPGSNSRARSRELAVATSSAPDAENENSASASTVVGLAGASDEDVESSIGRISLLGTSVLGASPLGDSDEGVSIIAPFAPTTVANEANGASGTSGHATSPGSISAVSSPLVSTVPLSAGDAEDFGADSVTPRWEIEELESELEARTADVARLKLKLRKAVEEIEKRTAQASAAREARDEERRRATELADQLAMANSQLALAAAGDQNRSAADNKNLEGLEAELQRAKHRAGQLAVEVEELTRSHAHLQSSSEAERQALLVEAASLRLRTEGALDQLNEFSREIASFHADHAQHLAHSQQLMGELQAKLTVARAALAGRMPTQMSSGPSTASTNQGATLVLPNSPDDRSNAGNPGGPNTGDLTQLPGMTQEIANQLAELGVSSLHEIAAWSVHDVARMQEWLPEYPNIVAENRWVDNARAIVRSQRDAAARNLSGV